jgi:hypothetical protein
MTEPITEGEANNIRDRLLKAENEIHDNGSDIRAHEAVCAARFRQIITLLIIIASAVAPGTIGKILDVIGHMQ